MKLYVVSGLGADFKVLEKIEFPPHLEIVFLDWLLPTPKEDFYHFVERMAEKIDASEKFCLLGYSFGGIIVQEIHKIKPAEKVVILGSIKSHLEKSRFIKAADFTNITSIIPERIFSEKNAFAYSFLRKIFDPKNPKIWDYFVVKDPYYLKWSMKNIAAWKGEENPDVIQISGDKDLIFPIKYSKPDYVIKNGSHLFPAMKHKEVSKILTEIFSV